MKQVIGERLDVGLPRHAGLLEQGLDRGGDEQLVPDVGGEERVDAERVADAEAAFRAAFEKDDPECAPELRQNRLAEAEVRLKHQLGFGPVDTRLEVDRREGGTILEHSAEDGAAGADFRDLRVGRPEKLERRSSQPSNPARLHDVW